MSLPKRVSIVPPLPAIGLFKIETTADGIVIATPSRQGKALGLPSHVYDKGTGK